MHIRPTINAHASISSGDRGLNFGLGLHLHPYFVHASREGSGKSGCINAHSLLVPKSHVLAQILLIAF